MTRNEMNLEAAVDSDYTRKLRLTLWLTMNRQANNLTFPAPLALTRSSVAQDNGNVTPIQGQPANQAGEPLSPTNAVPVVFRLYRAPVGTVAIWEESQPNISVNAGRFGVLPGSRTELPDSEERRRA